jgi:transcriptional regulator with GAF, ATPase, and Fis domain
VRTQPPGMNEPPLVLPGPLLGLCETFFRENSGSPLLLYDLDLPGERLGSSAPPELEAIARRLGCRAAAFLPAVQDGQLIAVLMVGAPPELPAPLFRSEALLPFSNLIGLAAAAIQRIHTQHLTQRKLAEMETLWQFTQAVSVETDLKALLHTLHRQVVNVTGELEAFSVALYDPAADSISIPYMFENGKQISVPAFPRGQGLTSVVLETQEPLLLNTRQDVEAKGREAGMKTIGEPPLSWLGIPIMFAGEALGVLFVQDMHREHRYSQEDAQLLGTLASQVGVVVRNTRLLEMSRRQAQHERLVNEISDRIRRAADMHSILKTTADELGQALGARRAEIYIQAKAESED